MTIHHFGTEVDGSSFVEQVPLTPPPVPVITTAPVRPPRGTELSVRNHETLAALPGIVTDDYGYWEYTTTDVPGIDISTDGFATWTTKWSAEAVEGGINSGVDATTALSTANTALAQADAAVAIANSIPGASWPVPGTPTTFPPSAHTHPASQVSDASVVGRALITAADAQAARSAIGAGTGNGTSNLTLGTTATTAAPGNHAHNASAITFTPVGGITATDAAGAILQASTMGGSGGSGGGIVPVTYSGGAYPTQAASPPAGTVIRWFFGPVQYTGASWAGVLDMYNYANLT